MKKTTIISAALALVSLSAVAAGPAKVDQAGLDVLNALNANPRELAELNKHGDEIVDATVQARGKNTKIIRVTARSCRLPGMMCLGGATLILKQVKVPSNPPHFEYESRIELLR